MIFGGDGEYRVLNVLIFIYLSLVEALVEIWGIIVLVGYPYADEFRYLINYEVYLTRPQSTMFDQIHFPIRLKK